MLTKIECTRPSQTILIPKELTIYKSKNQIDAMEAITVESEPNVGTTLKIYIQ
jgi:hypothetical protein